MKGKKLLLSLALIIVLGICWLLSVRSVSGTEERNAQTELVESADAFAERKLYVRAIPLYEDALKYKTENNSEIQMRLLSVYQAYGNEEAWAELIEKRISSETAETDEYFSLADYYREGGDLDEALRVIKAGMSRFGTENFEQYYEAYRYVFSTYTTVWSQINSGGPNGMMPAYDGENWFYVNGNGKKSTQKLYQSATAYDANGFAVVKENGEYIVILENGDWYSRGGDAITDVYGISNNHILAQSGGKYSYYNYDFVNIAPSHQYDQITGNACGAAAVKSGDKWGLITDSGEKITDFVYDDVAVNSLGAVFAGGVAMVKSGGKWQLIDVNGAPVTADTYSDAKAPESDGYIAVANDAGKWGFIDHSGKLVIDYQYKDAKSFSDNVAPVKSIDTWGYLSAKNKMVIENIYDEAYPFQDGIARVKLGDYMALLHLDYID